MVGVAAVARQRTLLSKDEFPTVYRPEAAPYRMRNIPIDEVEMLVRTIGEPIVVVDALQDQVARVAPEMRFAQLIPMEQRIADTVKDQRRFNAIMQILGGYATVLTLVSLYTLLAFRASMRFRELGERQALGADSRQIEESEPHGGSGRLFAIAFVIGFPLACLLGLAHGQMYGLNSHGPLSALVAFAVFSLVNVIVLAGNWWPAYRASKAKPMDALRTD